jgi:hypothetical protein
MTKSPIPKLVQEALTSVGWKPWFSHCDKIKNGRKRKWYRNGADWTEAELTEIKAAVITALQEANVSYCTAGFEQCESWRGPYWAFIVRTTE